MQKQIPRACLPEAGKTALRMTIRRIFQSTKRVRSEEHTSELQSRRELVCRLLLEKKNHSPHFLSAALPSFSYPQSSFADGNCIVISRLVVATLSSMIESSRRLRAVP